MHANSVVFGDQLADVLWTGKPPDGASVTIRSHLLNLRRTMGSAGDRIISCRPGYRIDLVPGELDSLEFVAAFQRCRNYERSSQWQKCADEFAIALGLWRGRPLADVEAPALVDSYAPALEEMRMQSLRLWVSAELHLGNHSYVIHELVKLVTDYPAREDFAWQLMLALYRCGRQADSLSVYNSTRSYLMSELAVEPGAKLQLLHRRMLAADPVLLRSEASVMG